MSKLISTIFLKNLRGKLKIHLIVQKIMNVNYNLVSLPHEV